MPAEFRGQSFGFAVACEQTVNDPGDFRVIIAGKSPEFAVCSGIFPFSICGRSQHM
jgi:hypothetical protein